MLLSEVEGQHGFRWYVILGRCLDSRIGARLVEVGHAVSRMRDRRKQRKSAEVVAARYHRIAETCVRSNPQQPFSACQGMDLEPRRLSDEPLLLRAGSTVVRGIDEGMQYFVAPVGVVRLNEASGWVSRLLVPGRQQLRIEGQLVIPSVEAAVFSHDWQERLPRAQVNERFQGARKRVPNPTTPLFFRSAGPRLIQGFMIEVTQIEAPIDRVAAIKGVEIELRPQSDIMGRIGRRAEKNGVEPLDVRAFQ